MKRKMILTILAGLLIIGVASAALVNYLSNRAEATVTVESPITSQVSEDGLTWLDTITLNAFGGETSTVYMQTENKANATISGINENKISGTGIGCDDFSSVKVTVASNVAPVGQTELLPGSCINGTDEVELNFGADVWSAFRMDNTTLEITFAQNAIGSYVFSGQVLVS